MTTRSEKIDLTVLSESENPDTLFRFLVSCVKRYGKNTAYIYNAGEREFRISYEMLFEDVLILAKGFRRHGVRRGDKVMFLSDNQYHWMVTDLALMSLGAVNVPRGADTPARELQFIVENSAATFFIAENEKLVENHKSFLQHCSQLKKKFVLEEIGKECAADGYLSCISLLKERGYNREDIVSFFSEGERNRPDDILTIIYTSGTTGMPKGVMLTHANIMHNVSVVPGVIELEEKDSWLSILPSWHIFERTAEYVALARGTTLIYSSIKRFAGDLERYRPTLVATVPRVWESLYIKVQSGVKKKGETARKLFSSLVWISVTYRKNKRKLLGRMPVFRKRKIITIVAEKCSSFAVVSLLFPFYTLADRKLSMVRQRFGGRLRLAISGGGSLAAYLEEWIDAVGIRIVNAYGMTECSPAIAGRGLSCRTWGTLGPPVARTELRIVGAEGAPLSPGKEGHIEVKGDQVTPGYYGNEKENKKSFTEDGFFRTGDLGRMTIHGELVITGRSKEIIVLSSGENIDPTRIENAITRFPFIQDAVLVGQDKRGLGALLVPNVEELKEYVAGKVKGLRKSGDEFFNDRKVLDQIRGDINRILLPAQGFKPYEKIQNITFLDGEFRLGEELTNTLKKKRHIIERKYQNLINDLLA